MASSESDHRIHSLGLMRGSMVNGVWLAVRLERASTTSRTTWLRSRQRTVSTPRCQYGGSIIICLTGVIQPELQSTVSDGNRAGGGNGHSFPTAVPASPEGW
jgi:hypothetical protein